MHSLSSYLSGFGILLLGIRIYLSIYLYIYLYIYIYLFSYLSIHHRQYSRYIHIYEYIYIIFYFKRCQRFRLATVRKPNLSTVSLRALDRDWNLTRQKAETTLIAFYQVIKNPLSKRNNVNLGCSSNIYREMLS